MPDGVIEAYEAVVEKVDLDSIEARERVNKHDVKARIEEFAALAGHEHIHKGMTSRDLTENVEQLQVRAALVIVRDRVVATLARLAERADRARRHGDGRAIAQRARAGHHAGQAASPVRPRSCCSPTSGSSTLLAHYPLRGIKGPVGTQQDQLDLLGGDHEQGRARSSERSPSTSGSTRVLDSVGQVYPRSLDLDVVAALVQAAVRSRRACAPRSGSWPATTSRPRASAKARSARRPCRTR